MQTWNFSLPKRSVCNSSPLSNCFFSPQGFLLLLSILWTMYFLEMRYSFPTPSSSSKKITRPFQLRVECGSAPYRVELLSHEIRTVERVYEAEPLTEAMHSWYFQKQESNRWYMYLGWRRKKPPPQRKQHLYSLFHIGEWLFDKGVSQLNPAVINHRSIFE